LPAVLISERRQEKKAEERGNTGGKRRQKMDDVYLRGGSIPPSFEPRTGREEGSMPPRSEKEKGAAGKKRVSVVLIQRKKRERAIW